MAIVKWGFRRFYSSRQVVTKISKLVAGSNVQQSERSAAASVTSKRQLAIAARKKMLESFVDKYRAMNQGKFPPPKRAQKEVGGCYYFIKKLLQEMEYNVTRDDTLDIVTECHDRQGQFHEKLEQNLKDESLLGDNFAFKDSESTAENRHDQIQIFTSDIPEQQKDEESKAEQQHDETQVITSEVPEQQKDEESKAEPQHDETQVITSDVPEQQKDEESKAEPQHDETQVITSDVPEQQKDGESKAEQQHDETQVITSDVPEQQKDEESKAEQQHDETQVITSDVPEQQKDEESKAEQQLDETQVITSDVPEQQKDGELREKPSLWGNLKMLATGLINIWKK